MEKINNSQGKDYYTQRNNQHNPYGTCNVTAMIDALVTAQIPLPDTGKKQPEDALWELINSEEGLKHYKENYKWAEEQQIPPEQVHGMLSWGVNKFIGKRVSIFSQNFTMRELLYCIVKGGAGVASTVLTPSGHIVAVVGFITRQADIKEVKKPGDIKLNKVEKIIIDDPYGDPRTAYKNPRGNDIEIDYNKFLYATKRIKSEEEKWLHLVHKNIETLGI